MRDHFQDFAPFPFSGTLVSSFVLGLLLWGAFLGAERWRLDLAGDLMRSGLARAARQDELLELQLRALYAKAPIQLTLKSRKVYVGWVVSTEGLRPDMGFLKVVPTFSGFRTQDELSFLLTETYEKAREILDRFEKGSSDERDESELARLERFVRTDEIVSACFFDDEEYERHEERSFGAMETEAIDEPDADRDEIDEENLGAYPSPAFREILDWLLALVLRRIRRF